MYPQSHFLFPLLMSLLLEKLGYVGYEFVLVAVLVGVLVDLDHPLKHFLLTGDVGLHKAWDAAVLKHEDERTFLHHRFGMLVVTIFLIICFAYWPYWTTAVALGYYTHMLLDHMTVRWTLVDNRSIQDYFGKKKPVRVHVFGLVMELARYEIVFDVINILGIMIMIIYN